MKDTYVISEVEKNNGVRTKELHVIKDENGETMYDLSAWFTDNDGTKKAQKGVVLYREEAKTLRQLINNALQ